ncbi:MAG: zinc ribbon domain-containing protein [Halovenus sp.]
MTADWAIGALTAMLLVHLTVVLYALLRDDTTTESGPTSISNRKQYVTDDGVACPNCGEINEPDYKYCRQCVSELPTGVSFLRASSGPQSRRTL